jgi:serine/threonine protein phosphatase 1
MGKPGSLHVIGDIHGCLGPLRALIERVGPGPQDRLLFIGDYIDRGPDARGVVEFLLGLPGRPTFLLGNHERMLLEYLETGDPSLWLANGGGVTLDSYGGDPRRIPPTHLAFFRSLRPYVEQEEYLFVHAGLRPGIPLAEQALEDLLWIREEFLAHPAPYAKTVVFGHTPLREVFLGRDRIGIDTGCVYGGKLTCLQLPGRTVVQVPGLRPGVRRAAG